MSSASARLPATFSARGHHPARIKLPRPLSLPARIKLPRPLSLPARIKLPRLLSLPARIKLPRLLSLPARLVAASLHLPVVGLHILAVLAGQGCGTLLFDCPTPLRTLALQGPTDLPDFADLAHQNLLPLMPTLTSADAAAPLHIHAAAPSPMARPRPTPPKSVSCSHAPIARKATW